jgi:hypothetical protein
MVIVKANKDSEAGVLPPPELFEAMGKFNEEMVKTGVMLAGEGLHPTAKGARIRLLLKTSFQIVHTTEGDFPQT